MNGITLYHYPNCSTCRKAIKALQQYGVEVILMNIVDSPPSLAEIQKMSAAIPGGVKKLLNTSGEVYRSLQLKDRLPSMTEPEIQELLASNGKLIKRPFLISQKTTLVGFNEEEWKSTFLK